MTGQTDSKLLHRLPVREQRREDLPRSIQFYGELIQLQNEAKSWIIVKKPNFTTDLVRDRLSQGTPLLLFDNFSPDWHQVQMLFEQVAAWANQDSKAPPGEKQSLIRIGTDIPRLTKLAEAWYLGHFSKDAVKEDGVDHELLGSIITTTLMPFLAAYAKLLIPEVEQELWRRRYCPICGGSPDLAYLDKSAGARWLLCSRCDAGWLFVRLECPYCGTHNQDSLTYFTDDGQPLYRLYVCDECRAYIKAVDLRHATSAALLALERIITLDMDRQAQEKGYKPGAGTALTSGKFCR